ncbi:MAG: hypothetical protein FPoV2_gp3 [Fushun polycipivirus 2]|nr:MAG: hypothetical protein FPoV2_gp3 [Fushun polycipivirus 2]
MTEPQALFNPPVFPLQPQVPPPQTVTGVLNEIGLDVLNTAPINGQAPSQEFWLSRQEYCGLFTATANKNHILSFDILKFIGSLDNRADTPLLARPPLVWPRMYLLNSAQFLRPKVTYTFWAIKPLATAGKIRFVYTPDAAFGMAEGMFASRADAGLPSVWVDGESVAFTADTRQRNYVWEWDLKAQNVISLTFEGNSPLNVIPANTGLPITQKLDSLSQEEGLPYFQTTFGLLSLYWQNAYIPGSIYPDVFNIAIFKSLAGTQAFLQTGFRSGSIMTTR